MKSFISVNELIKATQDKEIDLGKGDPYNRLRYYTKMGWLPHMIRKNDQGHYPTWVLGRLEFIDALKKQNLSNEEIGKRIEEQNRIQSVEQVLSSKQIKIRALIYATAAILSLLILLQLGLIEVKMPRGSSKFLEKLEFTPSYNK